MADTHHPDHLDDDIGWFHSSVYNAEGSFEPNESSVYTLNTITAKQCEHGSVSVQFDGCHGTKANCLSITPGWNE